MLEQARKDYELSKNNKVTDFEIVSKMEHNEEYKRFFTALLKLEAEEMANRGYAVQPNSYAEDRIAIMKMSASQITDEQKNKFENDFNHKYPLGFKNVSDVEQEAVKDFEKSKNNKITDFEIAQKIERNEEYKQAFTELLKNEARLLNSERGYNFNVEQYAQDRLSVLAKSADYLLESQKETFMQEFNQKHGAKFPDKSQEANKIFSDVLKSEPLDKRLAEVQTAQDFLNKDPKKFTEKAEQFFEKEKGKSIPAELASKFRNGQEFANAMKDKVLTESKRIAQNVEKFGEIAKKSITQLKSFNANSFKYANQQAKELIEQKSQSQKLTQKQGMRM